MSFFARKQKDVFERRKKQQEVWSAVRRIIDTSAPNMAPYTGDSRAQDRCNRCLPAIVVPLDAEGTPTGGQLFGISRDVCDNGIGLVVHESLDAELVLCGFWVGQPLLFLGNVRRITPYGGCFWLVGIELTDVLCASEAERLAPLVQQLAPTETAPCG